MFSAAEGYLSLYTAVCLQIETLNSFTPLQFHLLSILSTICTNTPSHLTLVSSQQACVCVRLCARGWWMRVCEWQNLKWSPAPQKRVLPVGSFHLEKRGVRCHNGTHTQNTCTRIHDEWISRWSATQKQQSSLSELRNPLISLWFRRKFPELLFDIITRAAWKPSAHLPDCLGCYSNPLWKKEPLKPGIRSSDEAAKNGTKWRTIHRRSSRSFLKYSCSNLSVDTLVTLSANQPTLHRMLEIWI